MVSRPSKCTVVVASAKWNVLHSPGMSVLLGSRSVRVIDCHCHLAPVDWSAPTAPQLMFKYQEVLDEQERGGIDLAVFGNNWIRVPERFSALEAVRRYNDFAAEMSSRYDGRLLGL